MAEILVSVYRCGVSSRESGHEAKPVGRAAAELYMP